VPLAASRLQICWFFWAMLTASVNERLMVVYDCLQSSNPTTTRCTLPNGSRHTAKTYLALRMTLTGLSTNCDQQMTSAPSGVDHRHPSHCDVTVSHADSHPLHLHTATSVDTLPTQKKVFLTNHLAATSKTNTTITKRQHKN